VGLGRGSLVVEFCFLFMAIYATDRCCGSSGIRTPVRGPSVLVPGSALLERVAAAPSLIVS
jgi:hypothetical protein